MINVYSYLLLVHRLYSTGDRERVARSVMTRIEVSEMWPVVVVSS